MTPVDAGRGRSTVGWLARGLQLALLGLVGYGALAGNAALLVNALLALPLTLVPDGLAWRYDHPVDDRLTAWIAAAAVVHAAGFLGPYGARTGLWSWYDQAAHAVSASFVAGVGYAVVVALDRRSPHERFPAPFRVVFTLCLVMAFGVAWEIVEFGVGGLAGALGGGPGPLVQYGTDDIVYDLAFDALAAVAVALWGTRVFRDVVAIVARRLPGSRAR